MHNSATIVGYLGADPEARYTQGGIAVTTLRIATSERWRDSAGEQQERTDWHRVVCWGRTAEAAAKHLTKGRAVCAVGPLRSSEWTDKDGQRRWRYEMHAERVVFLPSAGARKEAQAHEPSFGGRLDAAAGTGAPPADFGADDIPF